MPSETHQVHLDFDGVVVEIGKTRGQKIRKRNMPYVEAVGNTINAINEADDFALGSILTARFERRRASTIANIDGLIPGFAEAGVPLEMVGGGRHPYRNKVDALARPGRNTPLNVLIDDKVHSKCVNELAERMRRNPYKACHNYSGIVLVGFGMQHEQLPELAQGVSDHFRGRSGDGLAVGLGQLGTGVVVIRNAANEMAFVAAMPSHQPEHVDAMMDTVRAIHPVVA